MTKYWFRKRRGLMSKDMGYGWVPINWQGWVAMLIMIALIIATSLTFAFTIGKSSTFNLGNGLLLMVMILAELGLSAYVCNKKCQP